MTDTAMAAQARGFVRFRMFRAGSFDGFHNVRMATTTRIFCDLAIPLIDPDVFREITRGEPKGMPEAVQSLGGILANHIVRRMTIIARGHTAMTAVDPTVILLLHDVAVDTSLGITRHVRTALRIDECVCHHTEGQAENHSQNQASFGRALHLEQDYSTHPRHKTPNL
jgi:hypothetical protein